MYHALYIPVYEILSQFWYQGTTYYLGKYTSSILSHNIYRLDTRNVGTMEDIGRKLVGDRKRASEALLRRFMGSP